MRHGWLELSTWRRYIHQLEELLVSSDDPGFNHMIVHDKELTDRWTSLSHLLEHTEVVSLLLLLLLLFFFIIIIIIIIIILFIFIYFYFCLFFIYFYLFLIFFYIF